MFLRKLVLKDFRAFTDLEWALDGDDNGAGWHVLLGPNGSGKSGFIRAAAIAFTGDTEFMAARRPTKEFIRKADGVDRATISLELSHEAEWDYWESSGKTSPRPISISVDLTKDGKIEGSGGFADRTIWGNGRGWFSAAFGAMRRFTGGNPEYGRMFMVYPRLARHLSVFGEDVALTEALEWLRTIKFKQLERMSDDPVGLLDRVIAFVNQDGFLPHGAKIVEVSSDAVTFEDGNGVVLPLVEASDGYRTVLSMTFELIRLMSMQYGDRNIFSDDSTTVIAPGIVLIDEIDVHLHPSWQREIGPWLTRLFPAVQFIVTTHSPLICQSAVNGSVWTLPSPGTEGTIHRLRDEQLNKVLYGDILHVLNSEAFGGLPGRSEEAIGKLDRLAALNHKTDLQVITALEVTEQAGLQANLTSVLGGEER